MSPRCLRVPLLSTLLLGALAMAQSAPPPASIPPPPDLDQPVRPHARPMSLPPAPASTARAPRQSIQPVLPPHNPMGTPPTVHVRKVHGDVVEEYRAGGRLIMVRIIPAHGPVQTFYANRRGQLRPDPGQGPVAPVFFTIYQWGH